MTQGKDAGQERRLVGSRTAWWALLRTARDDRQCLAQGRPIPARNLQRLLQRRLGAALGRHVSGHEIEDVVHWLIIREGMNVANNDEILAFRTAFAELKGDPAVTPFPWQERLFVEFCDGRIPQALNIPTGLGKTSVIEIWLLAHLLGDRAQRPPMRLVYVVNRRTIVDQATSIAEQMREKMESFEPWTRRFPRIDKEQEPNPLSVSALRGALADNRDWLRYPHLPAIIIGTVDMIGSRLLFGAYRAGRWTKSMHAGLLGQDSLIVHDEAHLSRPFQKLLQWISKRQTPNGSYKGDGSPRSLRVLAMSATGDSEGEKVLELDQTDRDLHAVQKRIHARKRLFIHEPAGKFNLADALADLVAADEDIASSPKRVIVFVRLPKTAKAVVDRLRNHHKIEKDRVELLTGTIRGFERDALVGKDTLKHLLNTTTARLEKSVYLVSTSAGEVGADFDADHLTCDATTLDAMIQRLGRVNRRGNGDARVDVVVDVKQGDKTTNGDKMVRTVDWLKRLPAIPDNSNLHDASPEAIRILREADRDAYDAAIAAPPPWHEPHPATLDAWAMTSIQGEWPIAQPLDVYLHGVEGYEEPRTSLAWREEISLFFPIANSSEDDEPALPPRDVDERWKQFEDWLDVCPLRSREVVSDKSEKIMELLAAVGARLPGATFVRTNRSKASEVLVSEFVAKYEGFDKQRQRRFWTEIANETFILPTVAGGLSAEGMIDPTATLAVSDVSDAPFHPPAAERLRIWLEPDGDGELQPRILGKEIQFDMASVRTPNDSTKVARWRDAIEKAFRGRMKPVRMFSLMSIDQLDGGLLLFKPPLAERGKEKPVLLDEHRSDVEKFAANFVEKLQLEATVQRAIAFAGLCHDLGKDRDQWQASIGNSPEARRLAKSHDKGMNPALLKGYRHEFGSLIDTLNNAGFQKFDDDDSKDLALHLIAVHHGRGRPHFPDGTFDVDTPETDFGPLLSPGEIARRYTRLQRRFGHWGLAWIESLLMCADHAASRGEEPEDTK